MNFCDKTCIFWSVEILCVVVKLFSFVQLQIQKYKNFILICLLYQLNNQCSSILI